MWIWSKLSGVQWQDAWEERFYGNTNLVINEIKGGKTVRVEVYTETEDEALAIKEQFGGSLRELKNQNWAALGAATRSPLEIENRIVVVGERGEDELKKRHEEFADKEVISIPADMAFGTGDHATTSNCLRHLVKIADERKNSDWELLDLGTGSGVLAITAMKLGGKSAWGCDYDPMAVKVARDNVIANSVDSIEIDEIDLLDWKPKNQWSVVIANVFCDVLQASFKTIYQAMTDDGDVVISGILKDQWEPTLDAATAAGLTFPDVKAEGKWVTARGRKM